MPESEKVRLDITSYHDANENGVMDPAETAVPGATINVYTYVTAESRDAVTSQDGTASLTGLIPENLLVQVTGIPDGYSRITSPVLTYPDGTTVPGATYVVNLEPGSMHAIMVGLVPAPPDAQQ